MIKIAHRGNIDGPNPSKENHPDYLMRSLELGYDAEVDVWLVDGKFLLGHDGPQYEVPASFIYNDHFWIHAKNIPAISELNDCAEAAGNLINYFYHNTDDCVLTSQKFIWTYPSCLIVGPRAIAVLPEKVPGWDISKAIGVCTDFPLNY